MEKLYLSNELYKIELKKNGYRFFNCSNYFVGRRIFTAPQ